MQRHRNPIFLLAILIITISLLPDAGANSRIKDMTTVVGDRDNQLVGYGLVVGLAGNGDSNQATYTIQSIANTLRRFGINVPAESLRSSNVAAVMVTADIASFAQVGQRIDVVVSAMGDAASLQGGVLLQTPMLGADDNVYAVAQGPLMVGGMIGGTGGATVQRNHPTVALISGGALVEQTVPTDIVRPDGTVHLSLINPDYVTASRMAETINRFFPQSALARSPSHIDIRVPENFLDYPVDFVAALGSIEVEPDSIARVVLNERTGTIVATSNVRISEVAISHGSLTITVASSPVISQPGAFSEGETVVEDITDVSIEEIDSGFGHLEYLPTLEALTASLNALGLSTRDMMAIFQTLKRAGALQAELIIN
ncbi:MAG: flagellar basal body P-ring protein FlgI [Opitutales bacterium]|nr:flagellar basal body P-ring protein FlgI [Opitutales bacterium]